LHEAFAGDSGTIIDAPSSTKNAAGPDAISSRHACAVRIEVTLTLAVPVG